MRRNTRTIRLGNVAIGGDNPVVVQSMTTTDTRDVKASIEQIRALEAAGCELARLAVIDKEAARAIKDIKKGVDIPLVADIHFDYKLALESLESGVDGLRLNPGNLGDRKKIKEVVKLSKERSVPIRIGVNGGSLDKKLMEKHGGLCKEAMVESAMEHVKLLEDMDFRDIKISLKSSSVLLSLDAYRLMADTVDYPLHIGITEAGTRERGLIKSAMGLGMLLNEGIGDTIRVSLTSDPVDEVWAAYEILRAMGLRHRGAELISCPTCGRTEIDLISTAEEVDRRIRKISKPIKVAVMGCVVNGPGEAREADVGIAGGRGFAFLFKKGEIIKKIAQEEMVTELMNEINTMVGED